jgi:hypothetical protein
MAGRGTAGAQLALMEDMWTPEMGAGAFDAGPRWGRAGHPPSVVNL